MHLERSWATRRRWLARFGVSFAASSATWWERLVRSHVSVVCTCGPDPHSRRSRLTYGLGIGSGERTSTWRSGTYRDDLDLILADVDLADGDHVRARQRLDRVVSEPSSPTAEQMARLGAAEIARLQRDRRCVRRRRRARPGARTWWLYAQAVVGLAFCEDERAEAAWPTVRAELPAAAAVDDPADLALGDPRVLWLLTL
jgi:hypothetical protein